MARTFVASLLPSVAIVVAWLGLEEPRRVGAAVLVALVALLPALVPAGLWRAVAAVIATVGAAWMVFGAQSWELLPFRDERVLGPLGRDVGQGIVDFYDVFLPFEPLENPEMHALVVSAIFGFTLAIGLLVASRKPLAAAAVAVAGVGWPATLLGGTAVAVGAVALGAALSIPLVLRASAMRTAVAGALVGALVVGVAAWTSSATTLAREAMLDWESWDIRGSGSQAPEVRFAWDSNYDGIEFPAKRTLVLTVKGPEQATYWRASTLNLFSEEHWFEHLLWIGRVEDRSSSRVTLAPAQLVPVGVSQRRSWDEPTMGSQDGSLVEQEVEVGALADDRLVAAGTPVAVDARGLGTVFQLSGNVLRSRTRLREGTTYRIWSHVPDPTPAQLAGVPSSYPSATSRYLEVDGRQFPPFGATARADAVDEFFADPSYGDYRQYRSLHDVAARVTRDARTPYEAVLALESWFRQRGGFRYDESPPRAPRAPLTAFVTRTKAGYCQHFAGAMAAMLRMLGIPARVAVGFTSGQRRADDTWVVTDHEAHAWVEVWFPRHGWIPFDPTPGRGTFGGAYSFASDSTAAVAALREGSLADTPPARTAREPDASDLLADVPARDDERAPSIVALALLLAALWVVVVGAGKALLRRARYVTRDPRKVATASRRELEEFLRDQGVEVPPNAGLVALQRSVREELGLDGRAYAMAASRARFGPPGTAEQGALARREVRRLLRAARRELSLWARFRGLVSVRSLRAGSRA